MCTFCSWLQTTEFFHLSLSLSFFSILRSPLHGDFLLLYSTLKLIRALHLLIIWTFTWVPVPSDIHLIFLWVALAKITLFTCLLHINAAGKVAFLHLMRQLWLPLGSLTFSSCLGWFLIVCRAYVGLPFGVSEETLLLGRPLNKLGPTGLGWKSSSPISLFVMAGFCAGPKAHCWLVHFTLTVYDIYKLIWQWMYLVSFQQYNK